MTGTWANCDVREGFPHTSSLEPTKQEKQNDSFMGPRDLQSTTWYWNKTRLRKWDHYPVVVIFQGKELQVRNGRKRWTGWIPEWEDERLKFQKQTLCPVGFWAWVKDDQEGGLESLQGRLEKAAAVQATMTATRNKNKFQVPAEDSSGTRLRSWPVWT